MSPWIGRKKTPRYSKIACAVISTGKLEAIEATAAPHLRKNPFGFGSR